LIIKCNEFSCYELFHFYNNDYGYAVGGIKDICGFNMADYKPEGQMDSDNSITKPNLNMFFLDSLRI